MTLVLRLVLILFNDASLSFWVIDPSSIKSIQHKIHLSKMDISSHRTYLMPSSRRNGSRRSSMEVNCEKIIVFSSDSDLSSICCSSLITIRTLADVGRSLFARLALIAKGTQVWQWVLHSPSTELSEVMLERYEDVRLQSKRLDVLDRAHQTFPSDTHLSESSDKVVLVRIIVLFALLNGLRFHSVCVALVIS